MLRNDTKFIETWKEKREQGIIRFIAVNGGIFGCCLFLFSLIIELTLGSFREIFLSESTLFVFVFSVSIGILGALGYWVFNDRKYQRLKGID